MHEIKLPPELWRHVAQSLCYRCSRDEPTTPEDRRFIDHSRRALASLCLTSPVLYHAATPCLYHVLTTEKALVLLRTLVERPDLARHVRELHHDRIRGFLPEMYFMVGDAVHGGIRREDYHSGFLDLYDSLRQHSPEFHADDAGWAANKPSLCGPDAEWIVEHHRTTTIVALLPNLDTITDLFKRCHRCIGHLRLPPGSLPKLKTANITGGDKVSNAHTRLLRHLNEAAPNLTSLNLSLFEVCTTDSPEDFPIFPNVTRLTIDHCSLSSNLVVSFVNGFPRLENLALHRSTPASISTPPKWLTLRVSGCERFHSLKSLSLDVFRTANTIVSGIDADETLSSMENLEILKVDQACIGITDKPHDGVYLERTMPKTPHGMPDGGTLQPGYIKFFCVDSLPTSLKALHIFCYYWANPDNLWQAVLALALAAPQRLPDLKDIVLEFHEGFVVDAGLKSTWEQAAVWDEVGIKLTCKPLTPYMIIGERRQR